MEEQANPYVEWVRVQMDGPPPAPSDDQ